jgi:plasmid stabilization system protein ParE
MTYAVAMSEQAAREMEESAAWWAQERSVEQSERWYTGIRHAITKVAEQPDRYPRAAEDGAFPHPLRELHYGLGSRPTHRVVFADAVKTESIFVAGSNRLMIVSCCGPNGMSVK